MKWKTLDFQVRGKSHEVSGTDCQDSVSLKYYKTTETYVAVLADGVGSKSHSELASRALSEFLPDWINLNFENIQNTEEFSKELISLCRKTIFDKAEMEQVPSNDMNTTLLFVAIRGCELKMGQLGDGAICIFSPNRANLFCIPQNGDSENETFTLFSRDAESRIMISCMIMPKDLCAIFLSSDGLKDEIYYFRSSEVRKSAEDYVNVVSCFDKSSAEKLIHLRIADIQNTSYYNDDISFAIIAKNNINIVLPEDPIWICKKCGTNNSVDDICCSGCHDVVYSSYPALDHAGVDIVAYFKKLNSIDEKHFDALNALNDTKDSFGFNNRKAGWGNIPFSSFLERIIVKLIKRFNLFNNYLR